MKKSIILLCFICLSVVLKGQSVSTHRIGDAIMDIKGSVSEYVYYDLGSLNKDEIDFQVVEVKDIINEAKDFYMRYRYIAPVDKNLCIGSYTESDIPKIITLLQYANNIIGTSPQHTTQVIYITDSNQSVSVFKGAKEWKISLRTDHDSRNTQIDISEKAMNDLLNFLNQALSTIDNLK